MGAAKKVLLVEDDPVLGGGLTAALQSEGYDVEWAQGYEEGLEAFHRGGFDLVSLDIGLPDGTGTDLCKAIRQWDQSVPVVFITARGDEETVVRAFELGASDFVKKPFSTRELLARLRAHLGDTPARSGRTVDGLTVQAERREVLHRGTPLPLNRRQYDLLSYFLARPHQIVSRDQLLAHLGQGGAIYDRTIDSHLSQLRRVLRHSGVRGVRIMPVYGVGYRLDVVGVKEAEARP